MKNCIALVMVFILCNACQQEKDKFSDLIEGSDTTLIVDEIGQKYRAISNYRVEEIDNSINGSVNYRYEVFNGDFMYDKDGNMSKTICKEAYCKRDRRVYI